MSSRGTATVTAVQSPPIVLQGSTTMSSAGAGSVAAVAGLGVAGAALVVGGVVVGTSILIGKGVMWCGEKLEENYQNSCKA